MKLVNYIFLLILLATACNKDEKDTTNQYRFIMLPATNPSGNEDDYVSALVVNNSYGVKCPVYAGKDTTFQLSDTTMHQFFYSGVAFNWTGASLEGAQVRLFKNGQLVAIDTTPPLSINGLY